MSDEVGILAWAIIAAFVAFALLWRNTVQWRAKVRQAQEEADRRQRGVD
jgi:hypothetical protein